MADTPDLGSGAARLGGSSPPSRTILVGILSLALATCSLSPPHPSSNLLDLVKAENRYAENLLKSVYPLENELYQEFLLQESASETTQPVRLGGFTYRLVHPEGLKREILVREAGDSPNQTPQVILDENELVDTYPAEELGAFRVSPNDQLVAFTVDRFGDHHYSLYVRNLATGDEYEYHSLNVSGFEWALDNHHLLVTSQEKFQATQLWLFDCFNGSVRLLLSVPDTRYHITLTRSSSGRFISAQIASLLNSQIYVFDGRAISSDPLLLNTLGRALLPGEWLFLDRDSSSSLPDGILLHTIRKEFSPALELLDLKRRSAQIVESPITQSSLRILPWLVHDSENAMIEVSSFVQRPRQYEVSSSSGALIPAEPPLALNTPTRGKLGIQERLFAASDSGVQIPVTVVSSGDSSPVHPTPLMLYVYGSYGHSVDPNFSPRIPSLLTRGWRYAVAHVRGGGEGGPDWYAAGRGMNKKNSIQDLISCAEELIRRGLTTPKKLVLHARSAGALVAAAAVEQRPDLFAALILENPFLDVIAAVSNTDLPAEVRERDEWGNPLVPEELAALRSYSPIENVQPGPFPPVYVSAAWEDEAIPIERVVAWTRKMRALKGNGLKLYFETSASSRHSGELNWYDEMRRQARMWAFAMELVG